MSLQLHATTSAQLEAVAALLCAAFKAPPDAAFADRRLLHWKYFGLAEIWRRPCSFVLTQAESVTAHCAVAPVNLVIPRKQNGQESTTSVSGVSFMDWAGSQQFPGTGVLLLKRLMSLTDVAIIAGGSDATRAIIPKLGFKVRASVDTFARVVRPLRQWRTRTPTSLWRDAARLLRDTAGSFVSLGALPAEWTATPVNGFAEATNTISLALTMPEHGVAFLNYWLRCPTTPIKGYEIHQRGVRCGHFLLSHVGGQTRIADLRLSSTEVSDWKMAYRLAVRTATEDMATCEVVALASTPLARAALSACGLRWRGSAPLSVYDPQGKLAAAPPLCWSLIDDDAAYIT